MFELRPTSRFHNEEKLLISTIEGCLFGDGKSLELPSSDAVLDEVNMFS